MGTYVRMTSYVISDPDKPWITLFSSARLEAIADAIAAQPQTPTAGIYATLDGLPRPLSAAERIELFQRVLKLKPTIRSRLLSLWPRSARPKPSSEVHGRAAR